jgi:hypothetical protein
VVRDDASEIACACIRPCISMRGLGVSLSVNVSMSHPGQGGYIVGLYLLARLRPHTMRCGSLGWRNELAATRVGHRVVGR